MLYLEQVGKLEGVRGIVVGELAGCEWHEYTSAPRSKTLENVLDDRLGGLGIPVLYAWRASRVDVEQQTRNMHRSDVARIFRVMPALREKRVDELDVDDVAALIAALTDAGYKPETIKKSRDASRDDARLQRRRPEPGSRQARQAAEAAQAARPAAAEHVERVAETVPKHYLLPLLVIDECGPRVRELETAQVGDLDEHRRAIRVRWTVEKNDRYRHLELPEDLFDALVATLPAREDRDLEAPLSTVSPMRG